MTKLQPCRRPERSQYWRSSRMLSRIQCLQLIDMSIANLSRDEKREHGRQSKIPKPGTRAQCVNGVLLNVPPDRDVCPRKAYTGLPRQSMLTRALDWDNHLSRSTIIQDPRLSIKPSRPQVHHPAFRLFCLVRGRLDPNSSFSTDLPLHLALSW